MGEEDTYVCIFINVNAHIYIIFIDERSNHVPKKKKGKKHVLAGDSVPAAASSAAASQVSFSPGAASNSCVIPP